MIRRLRASVDSQRGAGDSGSNCGVCRGVNASDWKRRRVGRPAQPTFLQPWDCDNNEGAPR